MIRLLKTTAYLIVALALLCSDRTSRSMAQGRVVVPAQSTGRYTLTPSEMAFDHSGGGPRRVPFGQRWRASTQVGDGMGWTDGNTFISGFMPFHLNPYKDLVFVNVRGFAAHNELGDGVGGNIGIGYRRVLDGTNVILGISAWGDADLAYQNDYYLVGLSGEVITPIGEARVNGYFSPGGNDSNLIGGGFTGTPYFQNNFILINQRTITEHQYEGFDAEFGGPMPYIGRYGFNLYVGGYMLKTDGQDPIGGVKLRGEANVHEDLQLGFEFRRDDNFGNNIWANMSFQFPRSWREWWRKPFFRQRNTIEHLARPVERQWRAQVETRVVNRKAPLINPLDGQPIYVIHVNPNGPGGNGTFENPYNASNFQNTSVADIIRVLPGNFSQPGTLALFNNQRLLAANHRHRVIATQGVFTLPSQVAGSNPVLFNSGGGNVVQLANNNEVSGFDINGNGTGIGIVGGGIIDFNINRTNITNATNGIEITNFGSSGLAPPFGQANQIVDVTTSGNLQNGVALAMNSGGTGTVMIDRLNSGGNAANGLSVMSNNASTVNLTLTNSALGDGNGLSGNGADGFFLSADSGTVNLVINNNIFSGNADRGLDFDISGTAIATISADNNTIGTGGTGQVTVGANFTGSIFGVDSPFIPPDTMGAVGPSHVAELINGRYKVYDKSGNVVQSLSLDAFWTAAGVAIPAGEATFDPRILYDPQSGRWFAVSIDGVVGTGAGNRIYVAVSTSSDPTAGWTGFQFVGDSVNGTRFNDFDMLGIDADGLYIATNNFIGNTFNSISLYTIRKSDLLAAVPSIASLTRFENQALAVTGFSPQPVVNNGPSTGGNSYISAFASGTLRRVDINGVGAGAPVQQAGVNIAVPGFAPSPNARQPGPNDNIDTDGDRISGNIVRVGNSFWAAHSVASGGGSAIRWYQIDATTNTLIQSGTIADPNLDFYYPSIAVNQTGDVVIGFSGSGDNQFISTYAAVGRTAGTTTTFGNPLLLQQGAASYQNLDGIGRNRWGDYSATVVDPTNSNRFWTFQLQASATDTWATQITELLVGGTGNGTDGWRINLSNTATLNPSTFTNNNFLNNGATGLNIIANDTAMATNVIVTGNTFNGNATGMMFTANDMSVINSDVSMNTFNFNTLNNTGFHALANGGTVNITSLLNNIASGNTNGNGFRFEATSGGLLTLASVIGNTANDNGMNGMFIRANGAASRVFGGVGVAGMTLNTFNNNHVHGLAIEASNGGTVAGPGGAGAFAVTDINANSNASQGLNALVTSPGGVTSILDLSVMNGLFDGNADAGILIAATGDGVLRQLLIQNNTITNTLDRASTGNADDPAGDGIFLVRRDNASFGAVGGPGPNSGLGDVVIGNNTIAAQTGMGNIVTNNLGDGLRLVGTGSSNVTNTLLYDGNTFSGNQNGFQAQLFASAIFTIQNDANIYSSNRDHGVFVTTNDASVFTGTFLGDTFTGLDANSDNVGNGFNFVTAGTSQQLVTIGETPGGRRTIINGGEFGVQITNASNPGAVSTWEIRGTDITGTVVDGININSTSTVGATLTVGGQGTNQNVTITNSGDDGIQAIFSAGNNIVNILGDASTGGTVISGSGVTTGRTAVDTTPADTIIDDDSRGDGIALLHTGGRLALNVFGVNSVNNAARGLDIDARSGTVGTDVFTIGRFTVGNAAANARDLNSFNNNGLQGLVVQTTGVNTAGGLLSLGSVATVVAGNNYQDDDFSVILLTTNILFVNSNVQSNGAAGTTADGAVFSVGTNTQMNLAINTINPGTAAGSGGNAGDDIALLTHVSLEMNNAAPATGRDAMGLINLVYGIVDTDANNIPDSRTTSGGTEDRGIRGETFRINTTGQAAANVIEGSIIDGLYQNAAGVRNAGRAGFARINVFSDTTFGVTAAIPSSLIDPSAGTVPVPGTTNGNVFFDGSTNTLANVDQIFDGAAVLIDTRDGGAGTGSQTNTILYNAGAFGFFTVQ